MKCLECGGGYEEKKGSLEVPDENIGPYSVSDVQYYQCTKCGDLLFSPETSKVLERKRSEIMDGLRPVLALACKAVAVAMAAASIVLIVLDVAPTLYLIFLSVGVLALALALIIQSQNAV